MADSYRPLVISHELIGWPGCRRQLQRAIRRQVSRQRAFCDMEEVLQPGA